jgi:hypothetical protein
MRDILLKCFTICHDPVYKMTKLSKKDKKALCLEAAKIGNQGRKLVKDLLNMEFQVDEL